MAIIETKNLTVINDEKVDETKVNCIVFDIDEKGVKDGVNKTLNGYNFCLSEILDEINHTLEEELDGVKLIAGLQANTLLCSKNLDLNEDTLYDNSIGVDNPVITISEKDITRAKNTVKDYEYLIKLFNLLLQGSYKVDKPKYELLP